uniref:Uncharacterized protein n=1 Tax=Physcomitrium patens TaxID=3218 RepID=A0A2K1IVB0_PHYPA|nr:hypothetical protein PHYPA_025141 [Physcomitrium patens]
MVEPVGLVVGSVLSTAFSELIMICIAKGKAAKKCPKECARLEEMLARIKPDVEIIARKLYLMRKRNCRHDDLLMAQRWLDQLQEVMEKAKEKVRQCNRSRWDYHLHLSEKLTSSLECIKNAASDRVSICLQLSFILEKYHDDSPSPDEGSEHSHDAPKISADNWWLPSPEAPVKVNARENTNNRRPEHHTRPSHNGASHHNGHNLWISLQPNRHHFPGGIDQNRVPQREEFRTWPTDPSKFTNASTHHAGHHAPSDFIRW